MVKSTKWINIFKSKFKKTVSDCKIDNQILVVTITTNTSKTNDPYFPKLRYFEGGIIFGVVIYSQIDAYRNKNRKLKFQEELNLRHYKIEFRLKAWSVKIQKYGKINL